MLKLLIARIKNIIMAFVFLDKRNVIIAIVILVSIFVLGIIIGRYSDPKNEPSKAEALVKTIMEDQFSMEAKLIKEALDNVNSDRLRSFHKVCIL
jgi:VIT1/CCC1 family predicted Fe2+/Mn2+ transporter